MKHCNKLLALAFLILIVAALGGCAKPQQKIVGKWKQANGSSIEYFADGTANINDGHASIATKYSFLEDGRLKIDVSNFGVSSIKTYNVSFEGEPDTLTFTDEKGAKDVFYREGSAAHIHDLGRHLLDRK